MQLKESEGCSLEVMSSMLRGHYSHHCWRNWKRRRLFQSSTPMAAEDQLGHIILLQNIMFGGETSVVRNCDSEKLHSRILHDHVGFQYQNLHWENLNCPIYVVIKRYSLSGLFNIYLLLQSRSILRARIIWIRL